MTPQVVVIGGGYGGFATAKALDDVADVVLVERRDAFVHNIAALRAVVDPDWIPKIFYPYDRLLARGRVVQGRAVRASEHAVELDTGETLPADYLVLATGSRYPFPAKTDLDDRVASQERYAQVHEAVAGAGRILLLGAGPVGLELAGELTAAFPDKEVTIVDVADQVLTGGYDPALRAELLRQLIERGVEVLLAAGLAEEPPTAPGEPGAFTVRTTDGRRVDADLWFRCYGVTPVTDYLDDDLAAAVRADSGRLTVTEHLRLPGHDTVFAVGDVTDTAEPKMGGRAGRHAAVVAANIRTLIEGGGDLATYEPLPPFILVPLGPGGGAAQLPGVDGIVGPEKASELKGSHLFVGRYAEIFGLTG